MSIEQADEVLQELWDQDIRAWRDHWVPIFQRFAHDLVSDARVSSGQIILDVGTGTGVAATEAARRVWPGFVFGIDRSGTALDVAEVDSAKKCRNVRFFKMNADRMFFPDELFDSAMSNCGISFASFSQTISEVYRVLRKGGVFALNDWHLKDVPAHRAFSTILQECRTARPSEKLKLQRVALATMERIGNRDFHMNAQVEMLDNAGFKRIRVRRRNYQIKLNGVQAYMDLRLDRAALKQELAELSKVERVRLLNEISEGLKHFVHKGRFVFDWGVNFVQARKPR